MFRKIGLLLPALFMMGCSQLDKSKTGHRELTFSKKWVRSTLLTDYLKFRVIHRFQPIIFKDMIIQGNGIDGIMAYDRNTGHKVWKKQIENGVEAGAVVSGNRLLFAAGDGYFYSLNVYTGKTNWVFPIRSEGTGRPLAHDGKVYFISGNNIAYALDQKTGRQVWLYNRRSTSMLSIRGGSQPSVYGTNIMFGFNDGYLVSLNRQNGQMKWQKRLNSKRRFTDIDARPVIRGNRVYIGSFDEALFCLNAENGKTIWQYDQGGYAAATIHEDKIYYSTTNGQLVALDLKYGKEIWSFASKNGYLTQPQFYKAMVLVGESDGELVAVDSNTGRRLGGFDPGRGVTSTATVDKNGDLFFISKEGNLFYLNLAWVRHLDRLPWE